MNYQETLDFLYNRLPMFSRIGKEAYKKDLTNTVTICNRLGNPQNHFKSIHVGGTNGKGSVSHILAAVLQESGYKTGLYTSPHLYDFKERIRINGEMIPEQFIINFVEKVAPWIDEIEPSFFEITVAMAFHFFAQQKVDIAVIEVGLGGRLDSTNIITPELSVITNISFDHTNILGNTIKEIALEKAGIIKERVPIVIGEKQNETEDIFIQTAIEKGAPIIFAEDRFKTLDFSLSTQALQVTIQHIRNEETNNYKLDLPGSYQAKNVATVLTSIDVLKDGGWNIGTNHIHSALKKVKSLTGLRGRWEVLQEEPMVVLEVAHNEAGIQQMLKHINGLSFRQLHIIIGMVKDKAVDNVLRLLPASAAYYFTQAHIPRALDKHDLQMQALAHNLKGMVFENVNTALQKALDSSSKEDLIIICGSIFLVAEVRR